MALPKRWWIGVLALASLRLAHLNLLWSDEDYHLAAAIQVLKGRVPYRDFWYDKPPLAALFYSLIGGYAGWPLRFLDIAFVLACCWFAYRLAQTLWGETEGRTAALLLAFYTAFYLPTATIPFAVDGLLLLPHLAAVYFASRKRVWWSGVCCAAGLLTNLKAVFVAATCVVWSGSDLTLFAAGLGVPLLVAGGVGVAVDALPDFYTQVWEWGWMYSKGSSTKDAVGTALKRCGDWLAFHGALAAGFIVFFRSYKLSVWFVLSAAALLLGNHFAPRYFFQLLPVMVVGGSRGIAWGLERYGRVGLVALALLLLLPMIRFGPRYAGLLWENLQQKQTAWSDAVLDVDCQRAALLINARKKAGDTMFVWGYRPDLYVYTRLIPAEKFWDSQPLDGVPADRHLLAKEASREAAWAANRAALEESSPTFVVDGLGLMNPALGMDRFPDLVVWLKSYRLVGGTRLCRVYQRLR